MCCKTPLFIGILDILHLYFFEQKKVMLLLKASLFNVRDFVFFIPLYFFASPLSTTCHRRQKYLRRATYGWWW